MYMDRHYVKTRNQKTVYELGISLFRNVVISNSNILPRLSQTLLANIDRERNGETIDMPLMRSITSILAELGDNEDGQPVYEHVFEEAFLERTKTFYAREATLYLSESTCSEYLHKASQRMAEERARVVAYLEPNTALRVRVVTERELICKYMTKLIDMDNSGLISMLRNDKLVDLRLMYTLFRDIENGEDMLRSHIKKEILERGNEIMTDPDHVRNPIALVVAVLGLKNKYEAIVNTAFTLPPSSVVAASATASGLTLKPTPLVFGSVSSDVVVGATSGGLAGVAGLGERGPLLASVAGNTVGSSSSSAAGSGCCVAGGSASAGSGGGVGSSGGGGGNEINAATGLPVAIGPADKKFVSTINEGFERFINSFADAAEYVSLYVDKLLRRDFKGSSDDEVEAKLDSVMTLFRFIHDKDAFQRYFQLHLTKRLLHAKAATSDAERSFIAKMKMDCGYMYTSKMEVMFNDMKTSEETTVGFKECVAQQDQGSNPIDMSVSVLTTMSWPIGQSAKLKLPLSILTCMNRFERYYYSKHEGRRLTWQCDLGTVDVRGYFNENRSTDFVSVPALSMCVLMLFNERDEWTYRDIARVTNASDAELTRHLQSLSLAKYRVLKKIPMEKEVMETDVFSVNADFSSRNRRLKLQVISARKENEREKSATKSKIDDDRRPVIDTVIVRIMKHRKVLEHNKLIMEVTQMLVSRFEPNPQDIKKRIESLVEREFLERQQDKRQIYQYVA